MKKNVKFNFTRLLEFHFLMINSRNNLNSTINHLTILEFFGKIKNVPFLGN